jgi:hypothetical protein
VAVQIDEVLDPPEWPYASSVYVITSADAADVHAWTASIEPDEPSDDAREQYGWRGGTPPPGAPEVPAGHRPVVLFWD